MIAYDPRLSFQRDRRARFGCGFAPGILRLGEPGQLCGMRGRPPHPVVRRQVEKPARVRARRPFRFPRRSRGIPAVREKMAVLHGQEPGTYGKPALRCDEAPSAVVVALLHAEPPENRAGDGRRYAPFRIRNGGGGFATSATQHEMDRHLQLRPRARSGKAGKGGGDTPAKVGTTDDFLKR